MIAIMQVMAESDSACSTTPTGVDVPEMARSHAGGSISRSQLAVFLCAHTCERAGKNRLRDGIARTQGELYARKYCPLQRAQIGRNVMTVLQFPATKRGNRGRHRTGVPVRELIAGRVCPDCGSFNTDTREHTDIGQYMTCTDCGWNYDTDGTNL